MLVSVSPVFIVYGGLCGGSAVHMPLCTSLEAKLQIDEDQYFCEVFQQ